MSKKCAKCEKTVYPTEELKCLDKTWHKGCFKCWECGMTLNMKNYKGYEKKPYCNAHYPKTKHTQVAMTPEGARIAANTKLQSQVKYHEDFEKNIKGTKITVSEDPELARIKQNTQNSSEIEYRGLRQRATEMEGKRNMMPQVEGGGPRRVGSISDYDPMNDQWGSIGSGGGGGQRQQWEETVPAPQPPSQPQPPPPQAQPPPQPGGQKRRGWMSAAEKRKLAEQERLEREQKEREEAERLAAEQEAKEEEERKKKEEEDKKKLGRGRGKLFSQNKFSKFAGNQKQEEPVKPPSSQQREPKKIGLGKFGQQQQPAKQPANQPPSLPGKKKAKNPFAGLVFQAMYDYDAADDDEVGFKDGDLIVDCQPIDDGWMYGKVKRTGQTGMLPANYVEKVS